MDLIRDSREINRNHGFKTQVLAASIRSPLHVLDAAKAGAHVSTMPFSVREMLTKHPLTDTETFLDDWDDWNESGAHSQVSESLPVSECSFHGRMTPAPRLVTP